MEFGKKISNTGKFPTKLMKTQLGVPPTHQEPKGEVGGGGKGRELNTQIQNQPKSLGFLGVVESVLV